MYCCVKPKSMSPYDFEINREKELYGRAWGSTVPTCGQLHRRPPEVEPCRSRAQGGRLQGHGREGLSGAHGRDPRLRTRGVVLHELVRERGYVLTHTRAIFAELACPSTDPVFHCAHDTRAQHTAHPARSFTGGAGHGSRAHARRGHNRGRARERAPRYFCARRTHAGR